MSWFGKKKKKAEMPENIIEDASTFNSKAKTPQEHLDEDIGAEYNPEEEAKKDFYDTVLDNLPNRFVQYVADSPSVLRSYIHGLNVGKHVTMTVLSNIISQITEESNSEYNNTTLENIQYSINKGFLPIYNDHYDSELCSVLYNGIMPCGEVIDIAEASPEKLLECKKKISSYLAIHDSVPTPITPEYLELRMAQYTNFFNVTCDKCGTPHSFPYDVPLESFNCTLCDNELIIYINQLFKEDPYEEATKRI